MLRTKRAALFGLVLSATIAALSAMGSGTLDARAIAGLNTLTVSPSHGRTGALFQLTYVISPCQAAAGVTRDLPGLWLRRAAYRRRHAQH